MNINELCEICPVEVFGDGEDLFDRLNALTVKFDTSSEEAEKSHGDCDYRLVEKIEIRLAPLIGDPGSDKNRWYHVLDFYGDGVRLIEAEWSTLTAPLIKLLRELLCGEHEQFCVVWKVYEDFHGGQKGQRGAIAVFNNRILVTESVLRRDYLNA